MLVLRFRVLYM